MPDFLDRFDTAGRVQQPNLYRALQWYDLDAFTQGYVQALFFTNCSAWSKAQIAADPDGWAEAEREGQSDGTLAQDAGFADLAPDTLAAIIADCATFQADAAALLDTATTGPLDYDMEQAGRDFWFTRCGHGCGFWDRRLGEVGDTLSDLARAAGEVDAYIGDDGKVCTS